MRSLRLTVGTAMVLCLTFASIEAAPKGKGSAPAKVSKAPAAAKVTPAPKTTSAPKTKATSAPKTKATAPPKTTAKVTKAPKVTTTTAKASSAPKSKAPKTASETKLAKAETKSAKKSGTTSTATTSTGTTSTTTSSTTTETTVATIDFTQGKVGEKLTKNTKLADKLANQLTTLGYTGDVYEAAYGFKNLGQFVAAVNNAQNHDLSFEQLKTLMTGVSVDPDGVVLYANRNPDGTVTMVPLEDVTTPAPTKSLGQAKKTIGSLSLVPPTTTTTTTPTTTATTPPTTTTTTTVAR